MAKVTVASNTGPSSRPLTSRPSAVCKSALALLVLLLTAYFSPAQELRPTESQVEAAYLYNFGKFVTFPADRAASSDSFQICILGQDPFGEILDSTVRGESISGRKITTQRLSNMQQAHACSILFVSLSEESRLLAIIKDADQLGLLTVSEIKHFAERGGMIELVKQEGKIRFEVNLRAAQECHLVLSSELLKVAIRVLQKNEKGS